MPEGAIAEPVGSGADDPPAPSGELVTDAARLRQRAVFLRELAEARALLARSTAWHGRTAGLRRRLRQST
ncbi:hypothetical protein E1262_20535 [Jiangella aurantiaca]|uniref:Uncharacterized protein n=1 Tax=Jiangella aurantiaca TaxID=2530373 RepID=A0A4R5A7D1_9ACTN|nr:hypothetical protein [Jiangella aurantiaca]TDD67010.1 hypothetical protein E1262_20535 [Jiangella aurantiaca]